MSLPPSSRLRLSASAPLLLLCGLMAVVWLAGGASRADALGQLLVRSAAWAALVLAALLGYRPQIRQSPAVAATLVAALALALFQLVPLPPSLWQALPGRGFFSEAAVLAGQPQPWRPWSLVPSATANAASALVVPIAVFFLLCSLKELERARVLVITLALVTASALVGLLQAAGVALNNPLINETIGTVSGTFANRNHFALLMAIGCLIAPVWTFADRRRPEWRLITGLGLASLFVLTSLASGSRTGLLLGLLALGLGLSIVRQEIRKALRRLPRWAFPAALASVVVLIGGLVLLSFAANRAVSIDRLFSVDAGQDMRSLSLPTVLAIVKLYFPFGSGLGGFDPIFRIHEPFALLKLSYFNRAHNDLLEVVLDAGAFGLILLLLATGWWLVTSIRAWRAGGGIEHALPKVGSAVIGLTLLASVFDYPARTPIIMSVLVIAGLWLSAGRSLQSESALPAKTQHL